MPEGAIRKPSRVLCILPQDYHWIPSEKRTNDRKTLQHSKNVGQTDIGVSQAETAAKAFEFHAKDFINEIIRTQS